MTDPALRSFTSWKLDWINALMIGVGAREFRIAVCLLQFANGQTRMIFPSQARIACILGCGPATVERAIGKLVADGWLERFRPNRHFPNFYRFVEPKRDAMRDLRIARDDTFTESRWGRPDPSELVGHKLAEASDVMGLETSELVGLEPSEVMGKHLKGTPEGEHLKQAGVEVEVLSLEQRPFISDELRNTRAMRPQRDPLTSLDQLERDTASGRYRR